MLERLVASLFRNRVVVSVLFLVAALIGVRALLTLPVDAFPDTTPVQVQINTVAPALNPEEIERQVTFPVETGISGLPGLENVRSISKFGFSQVVATFDDRTTIYDARQLILERLRTVRLPEGIEPPSLGPIATGLGEVFHYIVRSPDASLSLADLRTLHDWIIKPELRRIAGVAEVNSWGGLEKQYEVVVEPKSLIAYHLTLQDVVGALEANNRNVGGGRVVDSGDALLLHGIGRLTSADEIANVVIASHDGVPVRIRDIAHVRSGHEIRRGAVTAGGKGEAVLGLGFMLMGENSKEVTDRLKQRVDEIRGALPAGVEVEVVYDRTELVHHVIDTVKHNLLLGAILVIVILFLLFGSLSAGVIIALTIPLSMVLAALGMKEFAIAASLLSLGAIDFGIIVDGSVVMAENNMRRLAERVHTLGRALTRSERAAVVLESSKEVARPVFFGVAIITLVLVPILTLERIEGKLFQPMALTLIFALFGALLIALFLTPSLSLWMLPRKPSFRESALMRRLLATYERLLERVLRFRRVVLLSVVVLLAFTGVLAGRLGSEFVPRLGEGAIVLNVVRLAGISIEQSVAYNTTMEKLLLDTFPDEIVNVWSRTGTAEVATDPMGTELTDVFITLKPRKHWRAARSQSELVREMEVVVSDLPGQTVAYTQPIEMRVNEMVAGIRTDLGIKVYGDDFDELLRVSNDIQRLLTTVRGAEDISGEQLTGQPVLRVRVDQDAVARMGIPADRVLEMVDAVGGIAVGDIQEGERRFPLVVRLPDRFRRDTEALSSVLIPTDAGSVLPLGTLASVEETEGPATITREWARRRTLAQCNIRGRDMGSFVREVRARIGREITMPPGYTVEFGGQFEQLERAQARFRVVVPLTLLLVFFLLYLSMRRIGDTLIVFTGIPLAAVGGVLALWLRGLPFSVSAAVGFIALCGIAVLNGQVLVSTIRRLLSEGNGMLATVRTAGRLRLRPVLATAITDAAGFLPMAVSVGVGAEVQRPLATVVIGGVLTSTLLTLFVLPILFVVFERRLSHNANTIRRTSADA
ncbi:MAG: CusA/CzcA family heavy metal efflux RND transporter [Candidatus Krumholzibacteria bacterium]|nr:CusA/CzcA family heavy metal efflux RND transporter [Candidatus Krumholzibacteria bacterium]